MSARKQYMLIRTTPGGIEYSQGPVSTVRAAAVLAAHVLADNARVAKSEAQRFSVKLQSLPVGDTAEHESTGYKFRIELAGGQSFTFTRDQLIDALTRLEIYPLQTGKVPAEFMADALIEALER